MSLSDDFEGSLVGRARHVADQAVDQGLQHVPGRLPRCVRRRERHRRGEGEGQRAAPGERDERLALPGGHTAGGEQGIGLGGIQRLQGQPGEQRRPARIQRPLGIRSDPARQDHESPLGQPEQEGVAQPRLERLAPLEGVEEQYGARLGAGRSGGLLEAGRRRGAGPRAPGAAAPLEFAPDASQPSLPAPFPVAQLPGLPPQPPQPPQQAPVEAAEAPAATPAAGLLRFLPPALALLAALLTVVGTLLPLFRVQEELSIRQRAFETRLSITQTAWGTTIEIPGQDVTDRAGAPLGVPLVLAAVLLFVAAFTAFSRSRKGRWLIGAGAAFTAGVVTTVGMNRFELSALVGTVDLEVVTAAGMWVLILATAAAVAAAVVAQLPRRNRDWADPAVAYADTPTPPSGVAITVLPPEEPD
ncbi:hypothetical protein [Amycolatopsis solani]|uniref:hypothetical protein n=1 Tax=Amycolatopsis solani TaxID=3028615 RepID=UPI0025B088CE|nr:hypothetical protein [Amycolatopsis sp. MEP2-6]